MTRRRHVVVVDDEPNIGRSLRMILEGEGFRVTICESGAAFRALRHQPAADLYLLDVRLPDGNGIDLLRALRQDDPRAVAVMISGHATIADAVEATRVGAFDFLEKPLARERVLLAVKNAVDRAELQRENQRFREMVGDAPRMIGATPVFDQTVAQAARVARSDVAVLLSGESGTGKELLAAHIHRESPVATGPFVKVNCAAIPTDLIESELFGHEKGAFTGAAALHLGRFELADGGTIFLDEVGDLQEAAQAKLLRVLQDGEIQRLGGEQPIRVAARVISATNRNLEDLVAGGFFRQDLLPPERVPHPCTGVARASARRARARVVFRRRVLRAEQFPAAKHRRRSRRAARALRLAGQRARAPQRGRADGDHGGRRSHHGRYCADRDSAARVVKAAGRSAGSPALRRA